MIISSSNKSPVISNWKEHGFKTGEEIEQFMLERKKRSQDIKELEKKTGFKSYEQRTYDDLDALYANKIPKQG